MIAILPVVPGSSIGTRARNIGLVVDGVVGAQMGESVEGFARGRLDGIFAGQPLPPADSHVEVARIQLNPDAGSPGLLRRQQGRTRPQKWIEHEVAATGN